MVAKGHFLCGWFLSEVDGKQGDEEAEEVTAQVEHVCVQRKAVGQHTT